MKNLKKMSVYELNTLKSKIEEELVRRETHRTTCIWSLTEEKEETKQPEKTWAGETYIS